MKKQNKKIVRPFPDLQGIDAKAFEDALKLQKNAVENFKKASESFLEQREKLIENFNKALKPILEQQEKIKKTLREIAGETNQWKNSMKIIYEAGWWFTPSFKIATEGFDEFKKMQIYAERYKKGDKKSITLLFFHIYQRKNCEFLISVVQGWKQNPYFKKWSTVINQALESHIYKKYSVSIPALLLTAEGIATDYCRDKKLDKAIINSSRGNEKIKEALRKTSTKKEILLSNFFIDPLFTILDDRIFQDTRKSKPPTTQGYRYYLNRHAVMHGLLSKYGSCKNSLQAFLLLDVLSLIQ